MTVERFNFQRHCAEVADGLVVNIGCNTDPAHLRATFGEKVINCDDRHWDPVLQQSILADEYFDCGLAPWPFLNDSAALVILGDILEHLTPAQQEVCLREARRVAPRLCITVPNDDRFLHEPQEAPPGASLHITHVTALSLRELLAETGWDVTSWQTVDYTFVPTGYFVEAARCALYKEQP